MKEFETNAKILRNAEKNPYAFFSALSKESSRIKDMLLKSEQLPEQELLHRAKRIKPLIRMVGGRKLLVGERCLNSYLAYTKPFDVHASYYFNCKPEHIILQTNKTPLPVEGLKEIGRFICYHNYGGYYQCIRPGVDEVLQQLPMKFVDKPIDSFEVVFCSGVFNEVYSYQLDRHVSTVILYTHEKGLPEVIKNQEVIIGDKIYY